jgi:protein-disulfide isomerase
MNTIMQEYGKDGDVAWVYRHFPIAQLHSKAFKEARATECAAELGGNSKFWEYINKLYQVTPSNDGLDLKELTNIATGVGLSSATFNTCLESGEFDPKIEADIQNAQELEAGGTPYSLVVDTKKNEFYPIKGAYPYAQVKQVIDLILNS